jgi:hypothetical protein
MFKEWKCVLVRLHDNTGKISRKFRMDRGFAPYAVVGHSAITLGTNDYLLYEREENRSSNTSKSCLEKVLR